VDIDQSAGSMAMVVPSSSHGKQSIYIVSLEVLILILLPLLGRKKSPFNREWKEEGSTLT